ncbi:MAG TPA: recombinase family protein [Propionibacteriaceae bacterium]|nr:recombinase family protein [Propionibacteriaceae bacterium]
MRPTRRPPQIVVGRLLASTRTGVSAYRRRVVRPGFEQLLTDLASGLIDGICVWDSDRLARQPRDLERLIDLYETRKGLVLPPPTKT